MRTTIELKDESRARLLDMAARRGEKGFSTIIGEAVDLYLRTARTPTRHADERPWPCEDASTPARRRGSATRRRCSGSRGDEHRR